MLNEFIDQYCERLGPGLWAEPLNLLTNLFFVLGGLYCLRQISRTEAMPAAYKSQLITASYLLISIGIGSGLFHSFATRWAMFLDVIPIAVFTLYVLWIYLHTALQLGIGQILKVFALFVAATVVLTQIFRDPIYNGSQSYFGVFALVFGIGIYEWRRLGNPRNSYLVATLLFALSLTFRTIDAPICMRFTIGTHFLWHTFNGCMLTLILMGEIHRARKMLRS